MATSSDKVDPGFTTSPLYSPTYSARGISADGRVHMPDGLAGRVAVSCHKEVDNLVFESASEYHRHLAAQMGIEFQSKIFEASINSEVMEKTKLMQSAESIMLSVESACSTFHMELDDFRPPLLHPSFQKALKKTWRRVFCPKKLRDQT